MENLEFDARRTALAHAVNLAPVTSPAKPDPTCAADIVKNAELYFGFLMGKDSGQAR